MQAAVPSTFELLNLADPVALFDQPPAGVDGEAIRQALHKALERISEAPAQSDAGWRQWLLAVAGQVLLANPAQYSAAIHLTQVAAPDLADSAALAHLRLIAMWRSGDREGVIVEAERILAIPTIAPATRKILRNSLRRWNLEQVVPARVEHLSDFWPDIAAAKIDPIAAIQVDGPFPLIDRIGPIVAEMQRRRPDDVDFLNRMRWGCQVHRYMVFAQQLAIAILAKPLHQRSPLEVDALAIHDAMKACVVAPDPKALLDCIEGGRSAMLVQAHAGMATVSGLGAVDGAPYSAVSLFAPPARRPQDFNLSTGGSDVALEFAKLARLTKKAPRIVRIFPDGAYGDTMEISVCGRPIQIGRGAASLAFLGKAATFFSYSCWTGTHFEFNLISGPIASEYTQKDEFEHDFGVFYAGCLEEIILGAPEDMVPKSGFWPFL